MSEHFQDYFLHVLIQLVVIIVAARLGAWLLGKLGQPQVVGEILVGLALGPSVLGHFAPEAIEFIFPADTTIVFRVLSELGLVLLMFLIGLEFDFSHLRHVGRTATGVAAAGIALPFALGLTLAMWMHPLVAADVDRTGFMLIVAVALSITAIPILGRIMIELDIQRTRLGTLTITAAAIDDALGWISAGRRQHDDSWRLRAVECGSHGFADDRVCGWLLVGCATTAWDARRITC